MGTRTKSFCDPLNICQETSSQNSDQGGMKTASLKTHTHPSHLTNPRYCRRRLRYPANIYYHPRGGNTDLNKKLQHLRLYHKKLKKNYCCIDETTSMDEKSISSYSSVLTVDVSQEMAAVNRDIEAIIKRCDKYCGGMDTRNICSHRDNLKGRRPDFCLKNGHNLTPEQIRILSMDRPPIEKLNEVPVSYLKPRPPRYKERPKSTHRRACANKDLSHLVDETDHILRNVYEDLVRSKMGQGRSCGCYEKKDVRTPRPATCLERYLGCQSTCRKDTKWRDMFSRCKHVHDTNCIEDITCKRCYKTPESPKRTVLEKGVNTIDEVNTHNEIKSDPGLTQNKSQLNNEKDSCKISDKCTGMSDKQSHVNDIDSELNVNSYETPNLNNLESEGYGLNHFENQNTVVNRLELSEPNLNSYEVSSPSRFDGTLSKIKHFDDHVSSVKDFSHVKYQKKVHMNNFPNGLKYDLNFTKQEKMTLKSEDISPAWPSRSFPSEYMDQNTLDSGSLLLNRNLGLNLDTSGSSKIIHDKKDRFEFQERPKIISTVGQNLSLCNDEPHQKRSSDRGNDKSVLQYSHSFISQVISQVVKKQTDCSKNNGKSIFPGSVNDDGAEKIDSGLCIEIIRRLTELMMMTEKQSESTERQSFSAQMNRLKQIRTEHLRNIEREIKQIEDLDEYLSNMSVSSGGSVQVPYVQNNLER